MTMEDQKPQIESRAIPETDQEKEKNLLSALNYISFLCMHLSTENKQSLITAIGNFNLPGYRLAAFKIIAKTEILSSDQINIVLKCLMDELLRTRLVMGLSTRGILRGI